jgi:hypothetical protein
MTDDRRSSTRRGVLAVSSSLATLGIAGCFADDSDADDDGLDERLDDDIEEEDFDDDLADYHDYGGDHELDVSELLVYDRADGEQVANSHAGHWHYETDTGGLPALETDSTIELETVFTKDGEELPLGTEEPYRLEAAIADDATDRVLEVDVEPDHVSLSGAETGETAVVFELAEDGEIVWEAPPIDAAVED